MSETIITVENLSKRYRLGTIGATSLRESVERGWYRLRGKNWREEMGEIGSHSPQRTQGPQRGENSNKEQGTRNEEHNYDSSELWALRDVSFEVKRGEVLGVIGRNGAGKSTLLKILTRITEPTSGRAIMRGRVASLLEVGTGFHPELTGRENVFLNGAILGMKRAEIARKFDEIVAFAEVEKFIDTPVKRYSSGMYVRLAFAVAAHLDPEILLVDEVLAVGDFDFQRKCLGKMNDVALAGRTVLFVSHNMGAVSALCSKGILLAEGYVIKIGHISSVVSNYMLQAATSSACKLWDEDDAPGDDYARLLRVAVCQPSGLPSVNIDISKSFEVEMTLGIRMAMRSFNVCVQIARHDGLIVCHSAHMDATERIGAFLGVKKVTCRIPSYLLNTGSYYLTVGADVPNERVVFSARTVLCFTVEPLCEKMSRYTHGAWKGVTGPGILTWSSEA